MQLTHPKYRPDIDGLRGVSILLAVAFHMFLLRGGFIGVEIFFVISGYLISHIIFSSLQQGSFSFSEFYARRVRRIFPAMLVVVAGTFALGWALLLPTEFRQLGKYAAGGVGFISNFIYGHEVDYFNRAADTKPLLHMWSLAVEEQFYLLWPPLVFMAWKWRLNRPVWTAAGIVLSFAACLVIMGLHHRELAFYWPVSRLWELLLGAALADWMMRRPEGARPSANMESLVGLGMIALCVALVRPEAQMLGWMLLLPTVGACMIIHAGPQAWSNRILLANRPMRFIGQISYPLYLWHWPLWSLMLIVQGGIPPHSIQYAVMAASFGLAWLTWRFVERNVRHRKGRMVVPSLLAAAVVLLLLGMGAYKGVIVPRNHDARAQAISKAASDWEYPSDDADETVMDATYFYGLKGLPKTTLFIGDSHIEQYWQRVYRLMKERPKTYNSVFFTTVGGCPPIPNFFYGDRHCPQLIQEAVAYAQRPEVDTLVIGGAWISYVNSVYNRPADDDYYFSEVYGHLPRYQGDEGFMKTMDSFKTFLISLGARHKRVFILLDTPGGKILDPLKHYDRLGVGSLPKTGVLLRSAIERENAVIRTSLRAIASDLGATVIDPLDSLCPGGVCSAFRPDGTPIYMDGEHLTASYCRAFCDYIDVTIKPITH